MKKFVSACFVAMVLLGAAGTAQADYASTVQALNPVTYWRFETNTDNVASNSGTSGAANDGTFGSSVTLVAGSFGLSGKSAQFNGDGNSQVTVPNTGFPVNDSARTVAGWVRTSSTTDWSIMLGYGSQSRPGSFLLAMYSGHAAFSQWGGSLVGTKTINDNTWHFIAMTVDPTGAGATPGNPFCSLYVDGQLDNSGVLDVNTGLAEPVGIGNSFTGQRWVGQMDELAVFTNALSTNTIQSLYNAGLPPPLPPYVAAVQAHSPLAYWRFETNTDNVASNSGTAGAANNGTFGSSVTLVAGPSGLSGNAAHFIGDGNSVITVPNTGFPVNDSARTVAGWVRTSSTAGMRAILGYGSQSRPHSFFLLEYEGHVFFSQWGGSLVGTKTINDNKWHFIAMIVDPSGAGATAFNPLCSIYVDGQLDNSGILDVTTGAAETVGIGSTFAGSPWDGDIDELAVFTSALSASAIHGLYTTGNPPPPSGTVILFY